MVQRASPDVNTRTARTFVARFIDAAHLARAAGRPARNLDAWLAPEAVVRAAFVRGAADADITIVEGAMGLFACAYCGKNDVPLEIEHVVAPLARRLRSRLELDAGVPLEFKGSADAERILANRG
jgi:hypothetical protein